MALEDGLTLGTLLGFVSRSQELPVEKKREYITDLIQLYETLRKKRTSTNQKGALSNRSWYHAREGPEMIHRNSVFKDADGYGPCEWKGADFAYQKELLGFDAAKVVSEALKSWQPLGCC
jgi:2-polyprenyl-6-methoxyphenol hydroxylase-like FAD-dependent oxidoreductase